jgi:hypothetical protein
MIFLGYLWSSLEEQLSVVGIKVKKGLAETKKGEWKIFIKLFGNKGLRETDRNI